MATVTIVKGDATRPVVGEHYIFIPHVVNDEGAFGKGFADALSRRWPETKKRYFDWRRSPTFKLGAIEIQPVEPSIAIVHMLCQQGLPSASNPQPLNYAFLKECLVKLSGVVREVEGEVHAPKFGCGLARGKWPLVRDLIVGCMHKDIKVTIYDHSKTRA